MSHILGFQNISKNNKSTITFAVRFRYNKMKQLCIYVDHQGVIQGRIIVLLSKIHAYIMKFKT